MAAAAPRRGPRGGAGCAGGGGSGAAGSSSGGGGGGGSGSSRGSNAIIRCGGAGRRAASLALLLALLALAAAPAAAQPACSMKNCARCRWMPAPYLSKHWPGNTKMCFLAKKGYAPSYDRMSVPDCAAGYATKNLKSKTCIKCAAGVRYAPRAKIGTQLCDLCPNNTLVSTYQDSCTGNPGWIIDSNGNVRPCQVDHACNNNQEVACAANTNTNGQGGQSSCDYVSPGYSWDSANNAAVACDPNTYATDNRTKTTAASCTSCSTGFSTANQTAQSKCAYNALGYVVVRVNGSTSIQYVAQACPANTYNGQQVTYETVTISCQNCPAGTNTNQQTTQSSCTWLSPGWQTGSGNGTTPTPCAAETSRSGNVQLAPNIVCTACATGTSTNGTTTQASCDYIAPGYYLWLGLTVTACPADQYAPVARARADAGSCFDCGVRGLSTNGATAQTDCLWVPPGYYYNGTGGAPCPAETSAAGYREWDSAAADGGAAARNCTACATGLSTNNATGQASCQWVEPGYGYDTSSGNTALCAVGTYAATLRLITVSPACNNCDAGSTTTGTGSTSKAQCSLMAAGYKYTGNGTAPCDVDTYYPTARTINVTDPTIFSCLPCANGTSTNGLTGQTSCRWLAPGYGASAPSNVTGQRSTYICPVDYARDGDVDLGTKNASVPCLACGAGLSTQNATGQAICQWILPGYFNPGTGSGPTAQACAAETYLPTVRPWTDTTSCIPCDTGLGTNGQTGQAACTYVAGGYGYNASALAPVPCGVDQYAPPRRVPAAGQSLACAPCNFSLTTNGAATQSSCNWVRPGWLAVNANGTVYTKACAADTYSGPDPRALSDPLTFVCTPCPDGRTAFPNVTDATGGPKVADDCAYVKLGRYRDILDVVQSCDLGKYNDVLLLWADSSSAACKDCANNTWTITTASTSAADCAYVKPGFYNRTSDNHIVPCPVNTYFSGDPPKKKTNQTACTNCPTGQSTNGQIGQTACQSARHRRRLAGITAAAAEAAPAPRRRRGLFAAALGAVPAGRFYDPAGPSFEPCPPDTFSAAARPAGEGRSCTPCAPGLSTGGADAQAACGLVKAGYWSYDGSTAQPCPAETYAGGVRALNDAASCAPCPPGTSTRGLDGQEACA